MDRAGWVLEIVMDLGMFIDRIRIVRSVAEVLLRALLFPLIVAVFVVAAAAQDARLVVKNIRDVKIGMSRESVLSGLSERYTCERLDRGDTDGFEVWLVQPKDSNDGESATVGFSKGKTDLLTIRIYPAMTGDAVRLAERLYRMIDSRAAPPTSPNKIDNAIHRRHALVPVELQNIRGDRLEDLDIGFTLGEEEFSIHVTKFKGHPDKVELRQHFRER